MTKEDARQSELKMVKELIKELYSIANCGLFNSRNILGDPVDNIFDGEYFQLDLCYHYSYFEIFGTTSQEFKELKKFYNKLRS